MELGSINLVVKDLDEALKTYLKIFGTNNVEEVIKMKGLNDTVDIVDGYYLKTKPIKLGIFKPVEPIGRMGEFLKKYGEGIHHIELYLRQEEFLKLHAMFKSRGWPVSEKPIYIGKLSEAIFWLEESGEQGVPVKFSTKAYHGFGKEGAVYLDTPKRVEKISISEEYLRPTVNLVTAVIATKESEKQQRIWSTILSRPGPVTIRETDSEQQTQVDDGRGDFFLPVSFPFQGLAKLSIYVALNEDAPINKILARRARKAMYHNMISVVTRDRIHQYWEQLEEAGFAMVDPKPYLLPSTGNYFFFIHPISTHGVVNEFVSKTVLNKEKCVFMFDWSDTETYIIPPEIQ